MTTVRIRINQRIIKKLRDQYENKIINEFGIIPTESQLVLIGLLELRSFQTGREIEIKFKNGKIKYQIK